MSTCFISTTPTYRPQRMAISSITNANPAVITTTIDHEYETGLIVRFVIPVDGGMRELNDAIYEIIVLTDNTFSIPVDSTRFNVFTDPPNPNTCAQVIPVGENNSILTSATRNVLTR